MTIQLLISAINFRYLSTRAVDIELDVTEYRNQSLLVLGGLFVTAVFFLLLILVNTSRTIQHYVQEPLESLHDIGKLGVPDEILFKPGQLSDKERKIMQNHASIGYRMLSHSECDILKAAAIIALQHHEKWDGTGYPQGLKGEAIHVYGRIVALADVFDALISSRVYKDAWEMTQVVAWIRQQSGRHFDPAVVAAFLATQDEFVAIGRRHPAE